MAAVAVMKRDKIDLKSAKKLNAQIRAAAEEVILIMTAEQALLAQRVVREAGHRK